MGLFDDIDDVFPIENRDIPASYVSLPEGMLMYTRHLDFWKQISSSKGCGNRS